MNIAIVGTNRGIGLEFVRQLSEKHNVYAFCRKSSKELNDISPAQIIEGCDVADGDSILRSVEKISVSSIDWLIHVSGIMEATSLENFNESSIEKQFKVNAIAPIVSTKAFMPLLKDGSKVGLLTSRMGSIADNTSGGSYGYRMSKAALNIAGVSLARDIEDSGIAVFLLHPGYVKTDMTNNTGMIDTETSVKGLTQILSEKTISQTGTFWHTNGEPLPW